MVAFWPLPRAHPRAGAELFHWPEVTSSMLSHKDLIYAAVVR